MNKKYEKCESRISSTEKQNNQRYLDKIFKSINGYTNPPRKKEEDSCYNTVRYLYNSNSFIEKELSSFMGFGRR